jgi:hypothetical protein
MLQWHIRLIKVQLQLLQVLVCMHDIGSSAATTTAIVSGSSTVLDARIFSIPWCLWHAHQS